MDLPPSTLPLADPASSAGRLLPRLHGPGGRRWLALLVDDNAVNREVGTAMLEELGLQVHTANDGREAVEKTAAGAPGASTAYDVVLMDLQMPRLDGLAATREIRALPQVGQVPVIAMTANAFEHSRAACMAAGMNDFLAKPIDVWQLADALRRWLPG